MKTQHKLLAAILVVSVFQVKSVPLNQFFPRGKVIENAFMSLTPPIFILNRPWSYLHVNTSGALSLSSLDSAQLQILPGFDESLRCSLTHPVRIYNYSAVTSNHASRLLQETLNYTFTPTQVVTITWEDTIASAITSSSVVSLQCVLATNGHESFIYYLYGDGMFMDCGVHIELQGDNRVVLTYTVPNNSIPSTSNVNQSGLWILKVNDPVIEGLPGIARSTQAISTTSTEVVLEWEYPATAKVAERFIVCCSDVLMCLNIPYTSSRRLTTYYSATVSDLDEYTNYTCTLVAENTFGRGPVSEDIYVQTNSAAPSGPPLSVRVRFVPPDSIQLDWNPPSVEHRNGNITGYRIRLYEDTGQTFYQEYNASSTQYFFMGLQEGTTYYCIIAAETVAGMGPFSYRMFITIPQTAVETSQLVSLEVLLGVAGGGAFLVVAVITSLVICCVIIHKQRKKTSSLEKATNNKKKGI